MNLITEFDEIILETTKRLGNPINQVHYTIIDRRVPHQPDSLPPGKMGICTFWHDDIALKIGRVGPNSNSRFLSQHYNPNSSRSNLAKSILLDKSMNHLCLSEANIGDWIKRNCRRIDILLDKDLGTFTLERIKASLVNRYEPKYEGSSVQL